MVAKQRRRGKIRLRDVSLQGTNLNKANLSYAYIHKTDLSYAKLRNADLRETKLSRTNLHSADLCEAIIYGVKWNDTVLSNIKLDDRTIRYYYPPLREGNIIGYKKANDCIIKLFIPAIAKRSDGMTNSCRCSEANVLSITDADGIKLDSVASDYDKNFIYRKGETVSVPNFDEDRWNESSTGIHFFLTREEAEHYDYEAENYDY